MQRYRAVVAAVPRGSLVLPVYTRPRDTFLTLEHAAAFVLLDRQGLIPYLFAGNRGDPMSCFSFDRLPYAPLEQWYRRQQLWNRAPAFTFEVQGRSYRWRFAYDPYEHDFRPAVLAPVRWNEIACRYPYILVTQAYNPACLEVPTRTVMANNTAALLAVDRGACRPAGAAARGPGPPPQVTY